MDLNMSSTSVSRCPLRRFTLDSKSRCHDGWALSLVDGVVSRQRCRGGPARCEGGVVAPSGSSEGAPVQARHPPRMPEEALPETLPSEPSFEAERVFTESVDMHADLASPSVPVPVPAQRERVFMMRASCSRDGASRRSRNGRVRCKLDGGAAFDAHRSEPKFALAVPLAFPARPSSLDESPASVSGQCASDTSSTRGSVSSRRSTSQGNSCRIREDVNAARLAIDRRRTARSERARLPKERERLKKLELHLKGLQLPKHQMIRTFLLKLGIDGHYRVFSLEGPDDHIRQALQCRPPGWVENRMLGSSLWHFKWCSTDCDEDYQKLQDKDLYNHFQNNADLTTKLGLFRSLRDLAVRELVSVDSFFPRCYDMSVASEREDFVLDFRRSTALQVLRQHFRLHGRHLCNVNVLSIAVRVLRPWVAELGSNLHEGKVRTVREEDWTALDHYASLSDGQLCGQEGAWRERTWSRSMTGKVELGDDVRRTVQRTGALSTWPEFRRHVWAEVLPEKLQQDAQELLEMLWARWPQGGLESSVNAWIVKPGTCSKGSGVACMKSLAEILHHCTAITNRIVQKYVGRPLLLRGGQKFDIRQWVCVRSIDPLEAYMYSDCYLRLCCEPFDLGDLANRRRHISNWAVNKSNSNVVDGAVLTLQDFKKELMHFTGRSSCWDEELLPKVRTIVLHCLNSVRHRLVQRTSCFEVYGFDLMVDADLTPWLLEVNLSPACETRTPWLATLLQCMATGLMDLLFDGKQGDTDPRWVLLAGREDSGNRVPVKCGSALPPRSSSLGKEGRKRNSHCSELAVVGRALSRIGRRIEILRDHQEAVVVIQRLARGYLGRLQVRKVRALTAPPTCFL